MGTERESRRGDGAGASALAKSTRLREQQQRRRQAQSRPSRVLRAVIGPSAQEKRSIEEQRNWATGARGEQILAESLARRCPSVPVLHDRRMLRSRANIDHIAFAPSGIFVIDTKRHRGRIEVQRPLFGVPKLKIAGRDRTVLIDGLDKQLAAVRGALGGLLGEVPVSGCLCFIAPEGLLADSGLPLLGTLRIRGHPLYSPRRLAKQLNRKGPIPRQRAFGLQALIAERLPPASEY
jgi:hypothetical protein